MHKMCPILKPTNTEYNYMIQPNQPNNQQSDQSEKTNLNSPN